LSIVSNPFSRAFMACVWIFDGKNFVEITI
jgi:hypothetical protein